MQEQAATRTLSIDVGYRNLAFCVGSTDYTGSPPCTTIEQCWLVDACAGRKPRSVADAVTSVLRALDDAVGSELRASRIDHVLIERQVRSSGMNFGIAHALMGYFYPLPVTFVAAKAKFTGFTMPPAPLPPPKKPNLKKLAIELVMGLDLPNVHKYLQSCKKKDDICDCVLQLLAHTSAA